jgi:hypothetical protein
LSPGLTCPVSERGTARRECRSGDRPATITGSKAGVVRESEIESTNIVPATVTDNGTID